MKKMMVFLLAVLFSSVCFATPEHDINFAQRFADQDKAHQINKASLCVRKAAQKTFSFATENGGMELLDTQINMGAYTLTLRVEGGELVASVKLHTWEKKFPKHCLYFYQENIAKANLTLQNGQVDMQAKYYIKMDLRPQSGYDAFSTYTVGYAW